MTAWILTCLAIAGIALVCSRDKPTRTAGVVLILASAVPAVIATGSLESEYFGAVAFVVFSLILLIVIFWCIVIAVASGRDD